jgi:hypothetical protein
VRRLKKLPKVRKCKSEGGDAMFNEHVIEFYRRTSEKNVGDSHGFWFSLWYTEIYYPERNQ